MPQMCPECSHNNHDQNLICIQCGSELRNLLAKHTVLDNRYRITKVLGCGGFGAVYLADDNRITGLKVAIKENRPDPRANPQAILLTRQQFSTEVSMMINLHHAGLPNVSNQFELPNGPQYMVMDFIAGDTLEDIVMRHPNLSEADVVDVTRRLLDILDYLHSRTPPIIHRDIKPANIKRQSDGQIVLVDFGIAKIGGQNTESWAKMAGTPGFAPLEQYGGNRTTNTRSDIYSLGAVMYFLLIGQAPPAAPDLASGVALPPPRKIRPELSAQIQQVIFKAMALNVDDRFQSVKDMRQALPGAATPPPLPPVPLPPTPNYFRWLAAVGGVGLLLTCLTLAGAFAFLPGTSNNQNTPTPINITAVTPSSGDVLPQAADPSATPPPAATWTPSATPPAAATWTPTPPPPSAATWTPPPFADNPGPDQQATVEAVVSRYSNEIKFTNATDLNSSTLSDVLIDPILEKQRRTPCWLRNEGLYYAYSHRSFDIQETRLESETEATVLARIKENRKLMKNDGQVHKDYGDEDYRAIYQLRRLADGNWYIYCLQALGDNDPLTCDVVLDGNNPCQ